MIVDGRAAGAVSASTVPGAVRACVCQSANQSVCSFVCQSVRLSVRPSLSHSVSQSFVRHSVSQSCPSVRHSVSQSFCPSVTRSASPSVRPSLSQPILLSVRYSVSQSFCPSVTQSAIPVRPSVRPSVRPYFSQSVCLSVRMLISQFVCLSVRMLISQPVHLSVRPYVCQSANSVCQSLHIQGASPDRQVCGSSRGAVNTKRFCGRSSAPYIHFHSFTLSSSRSHLLASLSLRLLPQPPLLCLSVFLPYPPPSTPHLLPRPSVLFTLSRRNSLIPT